MSKKKDELMKEMADALIECGGWAWGEGSPKAKASAEKGRLLALKANELLKESK